MKNPTAGPSRAELEMKETSDSGTHGQAAAAKAAKRQCIEQSGHPLDIPEALRRRPNGAQH
jgi:hypothetical protein